MLGTSPGSLALGMATPAGQGLAGIRAYPNPGSLFPLITPLPASPGPGSSHLGYHTTAVADVLPLSMRQVGNQVAALVALAAGVAIAVVRMPSLRRRNRRR